MIACIHKLTALSITESVEHSLSEFIRDHVVRFVEDDKPEIRRAAALSCCQVLANDPVVTQTSNHAIKLVNGVLEKLLTLAIADPGPSFLVSVFSSLAHSLFSDPSIRQATISHLDTKFDRHLAQAECVRSLFIALNDEVYAIREIAIKIIGRLAGLNPAYVMPSLRKTLIQLLTELEYSTARWVALPEHQRRMLTRIAFAAATRRRPRLS